MFQNTSPLLIGGSATLAFANAYLNEFRLSNGIARWTAAFTPPNQAYYARLDQGGNDEATKLLLHFDHSVVDSAAGTLNPHIMTNYAAFDGNAFSTNILANILYVGADTWRATTPHATDLYFGSGNFTIDFWWYPMSSVAGDIVAKRATNTEMAPFLIYSGGSGVYIYLSYTGAAWDVVAFNPRQRHPQHLGAHCTRPQRPAAHGLRQRHASRTAEHRHQQALAEHQHPQHRRQYHGEHARLPRRTAYIKLCALDRAVHGVARTSALRTQPRDSTRLLLHFDGANASTVITDSTRFGISRGNASISGAAQLSTAQKKFGNTSLLLNGASYIAFPMSDDWEFYNFDFTIEWWEYRTAAGYSAIARDATTVYCPFLPGYQSGGNQVQYMSSNLSAWDVANARSMGSADAQHMGALRHRPQRQHLLHLQERNADRHMDLDAGACSRLQPAGARQIADFRKLHRLY